MNLSVRLSSTKHEKHMIARAIVCGMLLLVLPSCGIPNFRLAKPGDQSCRQTTRQDTMEPPAWKTPLRFP